MKNNVDIYIDTKNKEVYINLFCKNLKDKDTAKIVRNLKNTYKTYKVFITKFGGTK